MPTGKFINWRVLKIIKTVKISGEFKQIRREMSEDKEYKVEIRRRKIKMSEVDNMEEAS